MRIDDEREGRENPRPSLKNHRPKMHDGRYNRSIRDLEIQVQDALKPT